MKTRIFILCLLIAVASYAAKLAFDKNEKLTATRAEIALADQQFRDQTTRKAALSAELEKSRKEIVRYDGFLKVWADAFSIDSKRASDLVDEVQSDLRNKLANDKLAIRVDRDRRKADEKRGIPDLIQLKAKATDERASVLYDVILRLEEKFPQAHVTHASVGTSPTAQGCVLEWEAEMPEFDPVEMTEEASAKQEAPVARPVIKPQGAPVLPR